MIGGWLAEKTKSDSQMNSYNKVEGTTKKRKGNLNTMGMQRHLMMMAQLVSEKGSRHVRFANWHNDHGELSARKKSCNGILTQVSNFARTINFGTRYSRGKKRGSQIHGGSRKCFSIIRHPLCV